MLTFMNLIASLALVNSLSKSAPAPTFLCSSKSSRICFAAACSISGSPAKHCFRVRSNDLNTDRASALLVPAISIMQNSYLVDRTGRSDISCAWSHSLSSLVSSSPQRSGIRSRWDWSPTVTTPSGCTQARVSSDHRIYETRHNQTEEN